MEPELTCVDAGGKSNGLGQLADGFMITVSLGLARKYEFLCSSSQQGSKNEVVS